MTLQGRGAQGRYLPSRPIPPSATARDELAKLRRANWAFVGLDCVRHWQTAVVCIFCCGRHGLFSFQMVIHVLRCHQLAQHSNRCNYRFAELTCSSMCLHGMTFKDMRLSIKWGSN
ncbi:unnamed protein product [Polarella glacialis]|uniref:Uncharacterized protein n=1 Tax=Polarella glacialis TaxID=89957 RepID=A0A813JL03_POLGL|nr:unnamed protein product [Polarella glacialis]